MTKLDEALGLFPSVIKCGEQWSSTCQAVLEAAKAELAELRAGVAATPTHATPQEVQEACAQVHSGDGHLLSLLRSSLKMIEAANVAGQSLYGSELASRIRGTLARTPFSTGDMK